MRGAAAQAGRSPGTPQRSLDPSRSLRIVVLGYVVRGPLGGMVWSNLQFLRGLDLLGHDVFFVEDSDDYPSCYDPRTHLTTTDPAYGLEFADATFARIGLGERWAYHDGHAGRWLGRGAARAVERCEAADVVLDLCGVNPIRPWLEGAPVRILLDEDPGFTQARHLRDPARMARARQHTHFFTFAENVGLEGCSLPADGLPWRATRQPVVASSVPVTPGPRDGRFTTVLTWESYPAEEHAGRRLGLKSHSFARFLDLPGRTRETIELAIGGGAPVDDLLRRGFALRDPIEISRTPWTYEEYLASSKAEWSVAKEAYVATRSGWFSERSVTYLALGRPVVVQDTGFPPDLGRDGGLLSFRTIEEAAAAIEEVAGRYEMHCRRARAIAEDHFDHRRVLPALLEQACGSAASAPTGAVPADHGAEVERRRGAPA